MNKDTIKKLFYIGYIVLFGIFVGGAFLAPLIAFQYEKSANALYAAYAPTCHQKLSRSFCVFEDFSIGDCTPQTGVFVPNDNAIIKTNYGGKTGYKIAICSRDVGIYGVAVLSALAYPFFRKWDSKDVPPTIYFILAIIPLAIDGGLQLLGSFGVIHYESTNLIRFVTGALAGAAITFYLIPLIMNIIEKQ